MPDSTVSTNKLRLSSEQVVQYQRDGYVLSSEPLFEQSKFERLKAIFEEDLEKYGEGDLDRIHQRDARLMEFLLSDEVLDLVEPVVGPNIGLWSSHFISKPAKTGKATPWHEDSSYWNGRISTMENICTVWLAMDKTDRENGCMSVIPGTQVNGFSEYTEFKDGIFGTEIKKDQFDESKAVYFELEPNHCSLHEARIIHGAQANTSDRRRAGYTMRYFPTSSLVYPDQNAWQKIWLARGKDIAGNAYEN